MKELNITYCKGTHCPWKETCKCYVPAEDVTEDMQFFLDVPFDHDTSECLFHWKK